MKRIKVVLIIMSLLAFASLGCQKSPTSPHFPNLSDVSGAEVVGSVVEARSNYPLPGATVYVIWKDSIVVRQTVTNENGKFYLNGLIPGLYDFIATAEGYLISKFSQVEIEPGENYICVGRLAKLDLIQQVERFYLLFKLGISLARQQQLIVESECRVREFKGSDLQGYYLFDTSEVDSLTEKITWFAWRPEVEAVGLCGDLKGQIYKQFYPSKDPIPDARVYAVWLDSILMDEIPTDQEGKYLLKSLIGGCWDLIISASGYYTFKRLVFIKSGKNWAGVRLDSIDIDKKQEHFYVKFKWGISLKTQQEVISESGCSAGWSESWQGQMQYRLKIPIGSSLPEKIDWFAWRPEIEYVGIWQLIHHD